MIAPAERLPYITRGIRSALDEALSDTPVVCILGPRQCGKSTLARQCDPGRFYLTLDDRTYLDVALRDPQGFIDNLPERVTIDEVQRAPELTLAIKRSVDAHRIPGRFILTGSANLLQLPRLADSLAGRMERLSLYPFTESEKESAPGRFLENWFEHGIDTAIQGNPGPIADTLPHRIVAGGYPEAFRRSPRRALIWQREYIRLIIERDLQYIADVNDGHDVRRLLEYLSHQTARLINVNATASALGHTRATIERYVSILEKLFLIHRLPAWHTNRSKRLVKTPKIHLCDSGLTATLSGIHAGGWIKDRTRFGLLLETFVYQQFLGMASWLPDPPRFWHYRDKDKLEVAVVIEHQGSLWGVEVKAAATANHTDGKGLRRLADIAGKQFKGGIVLYNGHSPVLLDKERSIHAVPLAKLWEM